MGLHYFSFFFFAWPAAHKVWVFAMDKDLAYPYLASRKYQLHTLANTKHISSNLEFLQPNAKYKLRSLPAMEKKPAPACLVGSTAMQYWSSRRGPTLVPSFLQERPRIVSHFAPHDVFRGWEKGWWNRDQLLEGFGSLDLSGCLQGGGLGGLRGLWRWVGSSGRRQREPDGRPAPTALWGEPESSQSETDSWPSSSNRDSYTRVWPPERNLPNWEKNVQVWEVFPPPPSSCDQTKVFQCFLVNEASDVGSEWLLRASEGNQEIL